MKTTSDHFLIITKAEILRAAVFEAWEYQAAEARWTWTGKECGKRMKSKHKMQERDGEINGMAR